MKRLKLQPLGKLDPDILEPVRELLEKRFGLEVSLQKPVAIPMYALNPRRRQFHAPTILRLLHRIQTSDDEGVLGITNVDLYVPGLTFVFGQAEIQGKTATISLLRLRPGFYKQQMGNSPDQKKLYWERAGKEAVHEIGHVLGLKHCPNPTCIMHFSNTIDDTDKKADDFCPDHRAQLKAG